MGKLFQELKRRKVFKVAAVYAVIAWGLIEVAATILPALQLPDWTVTFFTVFFILGFPVAVILAWAYEVTPEGVKIDGGNLPSSVATPPSDRKLIYAILFLVLLVAGFQLSDRLLFNNGISVNRSVDSALSTTNSAVMRSSIILNDALGRSNAGARTILNISPDGSSLAYAIIEQAHWALRNLATQQTQVLENTTNGKAVFSPDSQKLLLVSNSRITGVLPVQGGSFQPLPIEDTMSATWLSDESVIYRHADGDTRILSTADRTEDIIPGLDAEGGYYIYSSLPSGSAFLYKQATPADGLDSSIIQAYDLRTGSKTLITNDGYFPQYVNSGHILFLRGGDLWAIPFDIDSLEATGAEAKVLEGVDSQRRSSWGAYSVSDSGRLVYLPGSEYIAGQIDLYWTDRLGNREAIILGEGNYIEPRLSPNGELLAIARFQADGSGDIWVYNFSSGTFAPITFSGNARSPLWTPDGSRLVYQVYSALDAGGTPRGELWIKNADGTGQAERIFDAEAKADSFSSIDEKLIYMTNESGTTDLNTLTFSDGAWINAPLLNDDFTKFGARVSPDGRWIAYGSSESGTMQIYVQPYPNLSGGRWQVSTDRLGSREPSWGPNGDELFFLRLDGTLMHTEISIEGDSFSSGIAEPLITDVGICVSTPCYLVSNDGERFLHFYTPNDSNTGIDPDHAELVVISSFFEELKRLAPPFPQ